AGRPAYEDTSAATKAFLSTLLSTLSPYGNADITVINVTNKPSTIPSSHTCRIASAITIELARREQNHAVTVASTVSTIPLTAQAPGTCMTRRTIGIDKIPAL